MNLRDLNEADYLFSLARINGHVCLENVEIDPTLFVAVTAINDTIAPGDIVTADRLGSEQDVAWLMRERVIRPLSKAETWFRRFIEKEAIVHGN